MKVVKFGGSSLADGQKFAKVIHIIQADPERQIIVTSAPGKRDENDIKVTDLLITYANQIIKQQDSTATVKTILDRYQQIATYFDLSDSDLEPIEQALTNLREASYPNANYLMAAFKAHGERLNAYLMAKVLNSLGIKAKFIDPKTAGIIVTNDPNDAFVLPQTYTNLAKIKVSQDEKLVFPGFFGFTTHGEIATFARGGSDITGSILARGLHAKSYENFTDVNAIYVANPKVVKHPAAIKQMTYREMRELAYAGFSVFNDEAIIPAIEGQIPINVKNTNHPDLPGTLIVPENKFEPERTVTGVAGAKHFAALYLHRYLLNKQVGFTMKLLKILYKYNISYEHMPSGIDDVTVIFDKRQLTPAKIHNLCADVQKELDPDQLEWIDDYAIIMIVGEGMRNHVGVTEKIFDSLAEHNIGVHMINQGASRISLMLGTRRADAKAAVQQIYQAFF